eukprot:TRINITY_DN17278_c0_g1_i1.p1 TRINITY_DN17278_c0_g1~~TRINITY_DN17278_c0_g1_i1.p1  ORF type:complete len:298 (+),score=79.59 TRINITY_DN17278_c0_g1_i1:122-1015(+)
MFRAAARITRAAFNSSNARRFGAGAAILSAGASFSVAACHTGTDLKPLQDHIRFHDSISRIHNNVHILQLTPQLLALHTKIRDGQCTRDDFVFYSNRIMRLLVEEALAKLPLDPVQVTTPTGAPFDGYMVKTQLVGVSIVRAGESMEQALRDVVKGVRIGKILIQRQEDTEEKAAKLYYSKLPGDIANRQVMLLDPMLASGGSAICAVEVLLEAGVPEEQITFVNLVACPEGLSHLTEAYPKIKVVTSFVDPVLNQNKWIIPGLGDFGDRFYGTEEDQHGPRVNAMGSAKPLRRPTQ